MASPKYRFCIYNPSTSLFVCRYATIIPASSVREAMERVEWTWDSCGAKTFASLEAAEKFVLRRKLDGVRIDKCD